MFLITHFGWLIPYADELYGAAGMFPEFFATSFPSVLPLFDEHVGCAPFLGVLTFLSVCFTLGIFRRAAALLLWYGWACLINRMPYLYVPSDGAIGWLLLASALVPTGEPLRLFGKPNDSWQLSPTLYYGAWLVFGVGYSLSGLDKLESPSWLSGDALQIVLTSAMARDWLLTDLILSVPETFLAYFTWFVLALEILFLPLALFSPTRKWIWLLMLGFHIGIRLTLHLHTVTDPFLVAHLFLFDSSWLKRE